MSVSIDRQHLDQLTAQERERFIDEHPRAWEVYERSRQSLLGGVPMGWMTYWRAPFPIVVERAQGTQIVDIDGHTYVDYCLGEGAALFGHAPAPLVEQLRTHLATGISHMLPTSDAVWVGEALNARFGLPEYRWHFALSATDANRFVLRMLRAATGRQVIVVFNGCYHGTVEELAEPDAIDLFDPRSATPNPQARVRSIEFNDVAALEAALAPGDVVCVLTEPALTNVGTILPEPGFHQAIRQLTRATGTLLVLDETHTLAAGPGGCTRRWDLDPDVLTIGKAIGSGVPAAAYGFSAMLAERLESEHLLTLDGVGGTIAGSALSVAAMRATLETVATDEAFNRANQLAGRFIAGVQQVIDRHGLPWHTLQLGCRAEYAFSPTPARSLSHAVELGTTDRDLTTFLRLHAMNRGVLLVPFVSNVALIAPDITAADIDRHTAVFADAIDLINT